MKSLSIIQRISLGFAIILTLMVLTVSVAMTSSQQLALQFDLLARQVAPILIQSRKVTRELFAQEKVLNNLLRSNDHQAISDKIEELKEWQQTFEQDVTMLKKKSIKDADVLQLINELKELQSAYWTSASELSLEYSNNQLNQQTLLKDIQINIQAKKIKQQMNQLILPIGSAYLTSLSQHLLTTIDRLITSSLEALNQRSSENVAEKREQLKAILTLFLQQKEKLTLELSKTETAFGVTPEFSTSLSNNINHLINEISADNGLLANYQKNLLESEQIHNKSSQSEHILNSALSQLSSIDGVIDNELAHGITQTESTLSKLRKTLIIGLIIALICSAFILWRVITSVKAPLKITLEALNELSTGNMLKTVNYNRHDEFGTIAKGINSLSSQMRNIISDIINTANQLDETAKNNLDSLTQTHQKLELQRDETASVATAMIEMEQSVNDVASASHLSMTSVLEVTQQAADSFVRGEANFKRFNSLNSNLSSAQKAVEGAHSLSSDIGNILDVIGKIAEQTNLLALNAAIEAARAGEQGRGFSVVADEVRNLATRTTSATSEIQQMINGLQNSVTSAVDEIHSCSDAMNVCQQDSQNTQQTIKQISDALQKIADHSSEISSAAEQQSCTTKEISENLLNINNIADSNRDEIDKLSITSKTLQQLSSQQQALIIRFNVA